MRLVLKIGFLLGPLSACTVECRTASVSQQTQNCITIDVIKWFLLDNFIYILCISILFEWNEIICIQCSRAVLSNLLSRGGGTFRCRSQMGATFYISQYQFLPCILIKYNIIQPYSRGHTLTHFKMSSCYFSIFPNIQSSFYLFSDQGTHDVKAAKVSFYSILHHLILPKYCPRSIRKPQE